MSISTKSTNINTNSIDSIVPTSGTINIGTDQTTGILNIGCGKNVRTTGTINIGTDTTFGQSGAINISNIASFPRTISNGTINVFGALFLGAGTSTINGFVNFRSDGALPATTQLGGVTSATLLTTTPVTGSTSIYGTLNIPVAGIYIFQFNLYQTASTKGTTNYVTFSGTNVNTTRYGATSVNGNNFSFSGNQYVQATLSPYSLTLTTTSTCSNPVSGYITATRIT